MTGRDVIRLVVNTNTMVCSDRETFNEFSIQTWPKEIIRRLNSVATRNFPDRCFLGQIDFEGWTYGVITNRSNCISDVWVDLIPVQDEELITSNRETRIRFVEDILGKIPANIAVFNLQHKYLYVNEAAIKNPELRDWIIGKTDSEYCAYRGWNIAIANERSRYFKLCLQTKKEISWEEVLTVVGEQRTYLRRFYPVFLENGSIDFVIGYGLELTALRRAEKKLRENEEQYRNIIQNSSDIIYTTDGEGIFTFVNDVAQKLTGFHINQIIGEHFINFVRDDFRASVAQFYSSHFKARKQDAYLEFPIRTTDNKTVWIGQNVRFIYDFDTLVRVEAVARDITERKLKEEELLSVVNSLDDVVMQVDEDFRFLNVWAKDDRLLMLPASEFLGKTFNEVLGDMASLFEAQVTGVLVSGHTSQIEYQLPGMERWFSARFTLSTVRNDIRKKISVLIQDITEKKIALETIERNTNNLAALIDNTEDRIWATDKNFHLLSFNMAFLAHMRDKWNWEPRVGDKLPFDLFDEETTQFWIRCLDSAFCGEFFETERFRTIKGEIRYDEYSFNPIKNKVGKVVGAAIFSRNITARRIAEEELKAARVAAEKSSSIRQQFIANMSHEIRTPMNAIIGSTHLLMAEQLPPQQHDLIKTIRESAGFLLSMINDILDLSKIDSGKLILDSSPFAWNSIRDTLKTSLRGMADAKGIAFEIVIDEFILKQKYLGDSTRILQVLFNLIGNAIKFTEKGFVNVVIKDTSNSDTSGSILISVSDSGIGIPPDRLENIFTPFEQGDFNIARKYGGSGLGLAISRRIIRAMGSELTVTSALGKGSIFTYKLTLPIAENSAVSEESCELNGIAKGTKILIAEDHDFNRYYLSTLLQKHGFVVIEAENGRIAYEQLKEHTDVVLVILDIRMPEWDGLETLRRIRSLPDRKGVKVLAHTAHVLQKEKDEVMSAGFDGLIEKPVEPERLLQEINKSIQYATKEAGTVEAPNLNILKRSFSDPVIFNEVLIHLQASLSDNIEKLNKLEHDENFDELYEIYHKIRPTASMLRLQELIDNLPDLEMINCWSDQQKLMSVIHVRTILQKTASSISTVTESSPAAIRGMAH